MEEMTFEQLKDRTINYVSVLMTVESGCDPLAGEYSLCISGFIGCLDISSIGRVDDISLIKECIENDFDFSSLKEECMVELVLKESGEWEGYSWHKYYEIDRSVIMDYQ